MHLIRSLAVAVLTCSLALPAPLLAEEVPTPQEIGASEGEPPLIPHRIADTDTARDCLKCHETGKKGAPVTSHPERKACTQCHIPGEARKPGGRKK